MDASREETFRDYPFELIRSETTDDGLTLEGYAVVFDQPTRIESNRGPFIETMKRGAFTRTLNAKMPVLMFDHGQHPLIGPMPIGVIEEAREDAHGLFIRARLGSNWLIEPVREAIASGAVTGMSFRMMNIKENVRRGASPGDLQERDVIEVRCPELGPVVYPAYETTSVAVRSMSEALHDDSARTDLVRALWLATEERQNPVDSAYADPGFRADGMRRYPINTGTHVETAWAFINIERNQMGYTAAQVASIKQRIQAAAETFNVNLDELKSAEHGGEARALNGWTVGDLMPVLADAIEDQLYEDGSVCVCDFTDTTAYYSVWGADGEMELYEVDFSVDDAGNVTLGTPAEVLKKTTFVPATSDELAEGTSDELGRNATDPEDSTPFGRTTSDSAEMRRLERLITARTLGV